MTYAVTLEVLQLASPSTYQAYFQFVDSNSTNTATVGQINVAPGTTLTFPDPPASLLTEATVSFAGGLAVLRFLVTLDPNDSFGTPDFFGFGLNDGTGTPLPTADPLGTNLLLAIDLGSLPVVYAGTGLLTTTPEVTAVPEPRWSGLAGLGVLFLMKLRRPRYAALLLATVVALCVLCALGSHRGHRKCGAHGQAAAPGAL